LSSLSSAFLAFLASFFLSLVLTPAVAALRVGQRVRPESPSRHASKEGTPTMGGLAFVLATALTVFFLLPPSPGRSSFLLLLLGFGAVGMLDDGLKALHSRSLGLRAREKLFFEALLALGAAWVLLPERGTVVPLPRTDLALDLGWGYLFFALLVVVATANAANLTDGLDGLMAGLGVLISLPFGIWALAQGEEGISLASFALAGGLMGFLPYNFHPARIFMGDTGSLALGAYLAGLALSSRGELALPVIGGVLVLETLSVILQVLAFQWRGKRVFRMSPLHHHFELGGWPERAVVVLFWLLGAVLAGAGYFLLPRGGR